MIAPQDCASESLKAGLFRKRPEVAFDRRAAFGLRDHWRGRRKPCAQKGTNPIDLQISRRGSPMKTKISLSYELARNRTFRQTRFTSYNAPLCNR